MPQLTWIITGCSSGFGEQFASSLVARGDRVVATARKIQSIKHLDNPNGNIKLLELDVTAPQAELDAKMKQAISFFDGADVLVNNAGYLRGGLLEEVSGENYLDVYNTNVVGTINVTRSILPYFREKGAGTLVFIGSISGWQAVMGNSPYSATKFALEGIADGLQKELEPFGIKSIIFNPDYFRTHVFSPGKIKVDTNPIEAYAEINKAIMAGVAAMDGNQPGDVKKGVERMIDVVKGEGMASGKEMPKRLPLGPDAFDIVKNKCLEMLKICEEWEDFITSTR